MPKIQFSAVLREAGSGFVCLDLPKSASPKLGGRGRVAVVGKLNDLPIRTSVFPHGDGSHFMLVNKAMQQRAGVGIGDKVKVSLEVDTAPRRVVVPPDVRRALSKSRPARAAFDQLSYSHQKEYLDYVEEARRPETRARRIEKTVKHLAGLKTKDERRRMRDEG